MTHALAEQLARERVATAHARAAQQRRVAEVRRARTSQRWHRVADYARRRAVSSLG
ncbi:hypothetical protein GCM10027047_22220 [Rhodococcus aerolatus]